MTDYATAIVLTKALVFPVGGGITYLAYRAYRRTGAAALRSLALGFAALTAGAVLGGGVDRLVGIETEVGLLLGSALVAVGFGLFAHSLYIRDDRRRPRPRGLSSPER